MHSSRLNNLMILHRFAVPHHIVEFLFANGCAIKGNENNKLQNLDSIDFESQSHKHLDIFNYEASMRVQCIYYVWFMKFYMQTVRYNAIEIFFFNKL